MGTAFAAAAVATLSIHGNARAAPPMPRKKFLRDVVLIVCLAGVSFVRAVRLLVIAGAIPKWLTQDYLTQQGLDSVIIGDGGFHNLIEGNFVGWREFSGECER